MGLMALVAALALQNSLSGDDADRLWDAMRGLEAMELKPSDMVRDITTTAQQLGLAGGS